MAGVYQQDTSRDDIAWGPRSMSRTRTATSAPQEIRFQPGGLLRQRQDAGPLYRPAGTSRRHVAFHQPAGRTDRQWIYTPATERVRSVAPRERSERFAGSDFTYEDIAERSLDDFTYRLLNDIETIDRRKTYKVEATPVAADRSQYKFSITG